jgi:hypothetical protein
MTAALQLTFISYLQIRPGRAPGMKPGAKPVWILLILVLAGGLAMANEPSVSNGEFRILSWNISDDAYLSHPTAFRNLLVLARPDILLLDEVSPSPGADGFNN